ncbi:Mediator of RNA polymerase II transcription subunit-like protein [Emericellopsis cladophorae]|uniref:Mediator of RNA polymerase II transcription subunit 4 n=1 Tax=Emericellopsis cladophorae TaxID=2686198 RepID=A0A9P9Y425_9HYPO|nr:Mediator of RNA polymerase II transcription subunit-like protein [Emericellopsis cladophorae]KAI6782808.1 Mediator of RNA polymerase II transcription subunit-like protein [Emericellopsis cladophorae]
MNELIDARFDRLEKALTSLINSIHQYHPSTALAKDLDAADQELGHGLEQLQAHQSNHLRLETLRQTSSTLDTQIKTTLQSLASTRKDITTTQTTTFPSTPNYPVSYAELLNYARRISKTTMPPAGMAKQDVIKPAQETSIAPTPSGTQSPAATMNGRSVSTPFAPPSAPANANTSLPEIVTQYLNPLSGQPFIPWPTENAIRNGSLAANQILAEKGIEPRGYDPAEEEERKKREEESRKQKEEEEKLALEERERKIREQRERQWREERERRAAADASRENGTGVAAAAPARQEPKQFQFASLDDDDDDDEE